MFFSLSLFLTKLYKYEASNIYHNNNKFLFNIYGEELSKYTDFKITPQNICSFIQSQYYRGSCTYKITMEELIAHENKIENLSLYDHSLIDEYFNKINETIHKNKNKKESPQPKIQREKKIPDWKTKIPLFKEKKEKRKKEKVVNTPIIKIKNSIGQVVDSKKEEEDFNLEDIYNDLIPTSPIIKTKDSNEQIVNSKKEEEDLDSEDYDTFQVSKYSDFQKEEPNKTIEELIMLKKMEKPIEFNYSFLKKGNGAKNQRPC